MVSSLRQAHWTPDHPQSNLDDQTRIPVSLWFSTMPICNKTKKCWLLTLLLSFPFTNLQQKFTGFFFILFVSFIYFLSDLSLAYKPIPYSMSICHEYFVIYLIFILFCVCTVSFLFLFFFLNFTFSNTSILYLISNK